MNKKSCAIIVAAGSGRRMGGVSKPNIKLLGKTLFEYVLSAFDKSLVDGIVVVVNEENEKSLRELANGFKKPITLVRGGETRAESVYNGVMACGDAAVICAHDCARPFVTPEIINKTINEAFNHGAACVCSAVTDTIKYKDPVTNEVTTPERANMFAVQTPQCFKKELYLKAREAVGSAICDFTDETSLLEKIGVRVEYIKYSEPNLKLTAVEDIELAEIIMKKRAKDND